MEKKKHLVLMTRVPELPSNGFNESLPQFGAKLSSKKKIKKTEEKPDYCQHFIYMKVLQKAVKKIAWGFPQVLPHNWERKKHKLIFPPKTIFWHHILF